MIHLYSYNTPNGQKIRLMLEECGLPNTYHKVDITQGQQFEPDFLKLNPNNKTPVIVDTQGPGNEPITLFESGAILIYLAEKAGRFHGGDARERHEVTQWLMFQMGGLGPMLGQANHFVSFASERVPYAIERYSAEARRLYGVMEKRLSEHEFFAAGQYSIADMAILPWVHAHDYAGVRLADFPAVAAWHARLCERPAVRMALSL